MILAALDAATVGKCSPDLWWDGPSSPLKGNGVIAPDPHGPEDVEIAPENAPPSGAVSITGTVEEDQVLTADASGVERCGRYRHGDNGLAVAAGRRGS